MARVQQLQILRGSLASIPHLNDGEFYLATDISQLYVGFEGLNFAVGAPAVATVQIQGNANPTHYIEPNIDGSIVVSGIENPVAVTGTFFQSTQPISVASLPLPANAAQETGNLATIASQITTNTTNQINGLTKSQLVDPTTFIGANVSAKLVQATNFLGVQQPKDSGRTYLTLYVDRIAGITTEALVTMSINKAGTVTSGTSYTVTAGKTFRIQSINAEILNTTTTINRVVVRVRSAASVLVTSPIIGMAMASAQAALATAGDTDPHSYPDGLEIAGGQQIGISQLATAVTAGTVSAIVVGYEY